MRIAQVAPLAEPVPPRGYGGTERVVAWLTDELVRQGHDVTLFASGDSQTRARLVPTVPRGLRLACGNADAFIYETLELEQVYQRAGEFDVIHFHTSPMHYPASRRLATPHVTTLHGRLDLPSLPALYNEFTDIPLVSISDAQRRPLAGANWVATVHHGLPADLLPFSPRSRDYFAFIGRIHPEKRVDRAIEIAKAVGMPLYIAAKIDDTDRHYYESHIAPLFDHPLVKFVGEIGDEGKRELLGEAAALLFPIDWPEPFGLVMIEAMSCGTPVIAWNCGSVPEVMEHGVTGYIVNTMDEAIEAARRVHTIDRFGCRMAFERRFTSQRMAEEYVRVYERLIEASRTPTIHTREVKPTHVRR